jgi:hypothetical protein
MAASSGSLRSWRTAAAGRSDISPGDYAVLPTIGDAQDAGSTRPAACLQGHRAPAERQPSRRGTPRHPGRGHPADPLGGGLLGAKVFDPTKRSVLMTDAAARTVPHVQFGPEALSRAVVAGEGRSRTRTC